MSARIQLLSPRLANQIAAGEVVERPASVVKELLENSLDAGATRIEIEIERGGIQLIRISDNGSGIHPDDLPLALARHATSKIASLDDLAAVSSLGFRGEALASIASVAKLLLISRRRGEASAWQAFAEGAGMQVQVQPAALVEGTRIDVRDLFFNTPARRRFLRSEATEFAHIDEVVRRVALARPELSLALKHNGRSVRQWRAGRDAAALTTRVAAVLGRTFLVTAVPVDNQIEAVRLHGFVGHPDQHRAQADGQFVYVNGRAIRDRVVSHAIRAGFADSIPAGRSPCYALFIELPAADVDVNVHPTKHEVRFRNARWLHDWLTRVVGEAVTTALSVPIDRASLAPDSARTPMAGVERIDFQTGEVHGADSGRQSLMPPSYPATTVADARAHYPHAGSSHWQTRAAPINTADGGDALQLQRVSADRLLEWRRPPRLWRADALLQRYLAWAWQQPVEPRPLLLPVPLPEHFSRALVAQLITRGFQLSDGLLRGAPAFLRGADWPQLLVELNAGDAEPDEDFVGRCCSQHLLAQPLSQRAEFWQAMIAWAATNANDCSRELSATEWSAL